MFVVEQLSLRLQQEQILQNITFALPESAVVSIIGPSGAGKTSVLRCIAGLEEYQGSIQFNDKALDSLSPGQRQIGYVEQLSTLFPHLTIVENIAYPLRLRHYTPADIQQRVTVLLDRCGLTACAARLPHQVSGGEQRRAMLARALIYEPHLLLFDEPFSAVDAIRRVQLVRWLKTELQTSKLTVLYVTHDITEARFISTHALILDHGRQLAYGTWSTIEQQTNPIIQELLQTHF